MNRTAKWTPPRGFRQVTSPCGVRFCLPPSYAENKPKGNGRRADGVRYEKRVHKHLKKLYGDMYLPNPWIHFYDPSLRICQPDGILFDVEKGDIVLVEIKLRHCQEAYWQLRKLYLPLLRQMFPPSLWRIRCCEIVRWYDAEVQWPERHILRENIKDTPQDTIGVHIYNRED